MIFKVFFAALWVLSFQVGFVQSSPPGNKDIVQDVVFILKLLHASSFCSSFAPQPTVVISTTTTVLRTTPTTRTLLETSTDSFTASVTKTVVSTSVVVIQNTIVITSTTIPSSTSTSIVTSFSTVTSTVTATTNIIIPLGGAVKARGVPPELCKYESKILSSACHIYLPTPTRTTTLRQTNTLASEVDVTSTVIQSITSATNTILVSTTFTSYTTRTTTTTTTTTAPTSIQNYITTTTRPTTTTITASTISHTYSIAYTTTGCGDIVYFDYLQDTVVTPQQCLDFCDRTAGCQSVALQCSPLEPCECTVNRGLFRPQDYQCGLPTDFYGPITVYNFIK